MELERDHGKYCLMGCAEVHVQLPRSADFVERAICVPIAQGRLQLPYTLGEHQTAVCDFDSSRWGIQSHNCTAPNLESEAHFVQRVFVAAGRESIFNFQSSNPQFARSPQGHDY
jgi:hypothetical protein